MGRAFTMCGLAAGCVVFGFVGSQVATMRAASDAPAMWCAYGHPDASGLECDHIMSQEEADSVYGPLLDSLKSADDGKDIVL